MKPVSPVVPGMKLEEVVFAKNQSEYLPLPAVYFENGARIVTHWKLDWRERLRVLFGGSIWLYVLTFGQKLQPVYLSVESPKKEMEQAEAETLRNA